MPYEVMIGLSLLLGAAGGLLMLRVVLAAFKEGTRTGLMSLLVPGYVVFWGLRKMVHPKRGLIVGGALACFCAAGLAGTFSTSFEPHVTMDSSGSDDGFDDFGDDFDDDFDDLEPPED